MIYKADFKCLHCGKIKEVDSKKKKPVCCKTKMYRIFNSMNFSLRGSGWYSKGG